jgi:cyclopropane-fatty-acyl-phospholipid synthase
VLGLDLLTPRGTYLLGQCPGELGLARACISGDLEPRGVRLGDPYDLLKSLPDSSTSSGVAARVGQCRPLDRLR